MMAPAARSCATTCASIVQGATCARVCPVQELCEGACVLGAEHKPIAIGRLQRYAMDFAYGKGMDLFQTANSTGKKVAVIGAGPAGLSCAGELAKRGHNVTLFEKRNLAGGLSTFGIIGLREPIDVALAEVTMIAKLGVKLETGKEFGKDFALTDLQARFGAVFLSVGLGATTTLGIPGEEHVIDGLEYIEQSKLDAPSLVIGRNVVVIGAGNTAIDCATIAKRLGASEAIVVYRRTRDRMPAHDFEVEEALDEGVMMKWLSTIKQADAGKLVLEKMELDETGFPQSTGETEELQADSLAPAADETSPDGGTDQHPLHDDDLDDRDSEDFESEIEDADEAVGLDVILRKRS